MQTDLSTQSMCWSNIFFANFVHTKFWITFCSENLTKELKNDIIVPEIRKGLGDRAGMENTMRLVKKIFLLAMVAAMVVTSLSACGMKVNAQPGTRSNELDLYLSGEHLYFGTTGKIAAEYAIDQEGNITHEGKTLVSKDNVEPLTYVTEVKRIGNETYTLRGDVLEDGTIATEPKDFVLKLETNAKDVVCRRFILESYDFMALYFPYEKNTEAGVMVPPIDNDRPIDDIIPFATFQADENGIANIVIHAALEGAQTITIKDIFYNVIGEVELKFDVDTSKKPDEKKPADNTASETEASQAEQPAGQNTAAQGNGVQTNRIPASGTQTNGAPANGSQTNVSQTGGSQTNVAPTNGSQTSGNQNTGSQNNENQQPVNSANTNQITQPAPHQHTFESKVVAATERSQGYTLHTCKGCGYNYRDSYTPKLEHVHDYAASVVEPTRTTKGYTLHTCKTCGASYKDNYTDVLPCKHEHIKETVIAPSCTKEGCTIYECTDCGAYSYSGNKTAPLGHSWDAGKISKEATCKTTGTIVYTCATCGLQRTESIPTKPHSYVDTKVESTITEKGYTKHTCSVCGDSYTDTYTDPLPHEHSYNQRTVDATCEQGGYTEYTCTICGYSYRGNEIGALGHNYSSTVINPQVGIGGYTHHVCSRCGASYDDSYTDALPQPAQSQYSAVEAAKYGNEFLTAMGIPLRSYEFAACRQMVTNYDPSFFGYTQDGLNDLMEQLIINNISAAYSELGTTIGSGPDEYETVVAYCFGTDNPDGTIDLSCWYGYDGYHTPDGRTLWH